MGRLRRCSAEGSSVVGGHSVLQPPSSQVQAQAALWHPSAATAQASATLPRTRAASLSASVSPPQQLASQATILRSARPSKIEVTTGVSYTPPAPFPGGASQLTPVAATVAAEVVLQRREGAQAARPSSLSVKIHAPWLTERAPRSERPSQAVPGIFTAREVAWCSSVVADQGKWPTGRVDTNSGVSTLAGTGRSVTTSGSTESLSSTSTLSPTAMEQGLTPALEQGFTPKRAAMEQGLAPKAGPPSAVDLDKTLPPGAAALMEAAAVDMRAQQQKAQVARKAPFTPTRAAASALVTSGYPAAVVQTAQEGTVGAVPTSPSRWLSADMADLPPPAEENPRSPIRLASAPPLASPLQSRRPATFPRQPPPPQSPQPPVAAQAAAAVRAAVAARSAAKHQVPQHKQNPPQQEQEQGLQFSGSQQPQHQSHLEVVAPRSLAGTRWRYDPGKMYSIHMTEEGLLFEETHPLGRRVAGLLRAIDTWLQADLVASDGVAVGTIRLRLAGGDGDKMVSNFRAHGQVQWSSDVIAKREHDEGVFSPRCRDAPGLPAREDPRPRRMVWRSEDLSVRKAELRFDEPAS